LGIALDSLKWSFLLCRNTKVGKIKESEKEDKSLHGFSNL